ncbi:hypothetical protein VNO77_41832 [Canavalia gladiata]|uniref:Uncharacterized protein n=1 Tax=Canavalia gladiata TaxID=3824 RepID=A0AAN9K1D7_CANGL
MNHIRALWCSDHNFQDCHLGTCSYSSLGFLPNPSIYLVAESATSFEHLLTLIFDSLFDQMQASMMLTMLSEDDRRNGLSINSISNNRILIKLDDDLELFKILLVSFLVNFADLYASFSRLQSITSCRISFFFQESPSSFTRSIYL